MPATLGLHAGTTGGDGSDRKKGSILGSDRSQLPRCSFKFSLRSLGNLPAAALGLASPVRLNTIQNRYAMAQLPFPSNLPRSTSTPSPAAPDSPPTATLSPAEKCPTLKEQFELAMVAPSDSRAVAVYCGASIGRQKAFQQAALCKSLDRRPCHHHPLNLLTVAWLNNVFTQPLHMHSQQRTDPSYMVVATPASWVSCPVPSLT